jgi:hypothetical protein
VLPGGVTPTCGLFWALVASGIVAGGSGVCPGTAVAPGGTAGVVVYGVAGAVVVDGCVLAATGTQGTTVGCAGVVVAVGGGDGVAGVWLCAATKTVETAAPTISRLMAVVAKYFIL